MLDGLTVLELTAAALVVLGVLSVIAHFVNQARAKAAAMDSGKTRTVERASPVTPPEPRKATPPAVNATSPETVPLPLADDVPPSSVSLLPPVEPIPPASDAPLPPVEPIPPAGDAPLPAAEAIPPARRSVSERFSRFGKPRALPAARLKDAVRLKATRSSKINRRPKRGKAPNERRISFAPVAKAKPALTRRPKRVTQIRRKKITAPVRRAGKAVVHRSPHLAPG